MTLQFPSNPSTGQSFPASNGLTYTYDGEKWVSNGGPASGVTQIVAGSNVTISPTSGTGVVTVNSTGGGGGGVPEAPIDGNQYARKDAGWSVVTGGGSGGETKADIYGTAKAWGAVASDGSLSGGSGCTVSRTGTGSYSIVFTTPFPNNDYSVTSSFVGDGNTGSLNIGSKTASGFTARTYNPGNSTNTDRPFDFAVFDNEPAEIIVGSGTVANTNLYGTAKLRFTFDGATNSITQGSGASVVRTGSGTYQFTFDTPRTSDYYIAATGNNRNISIANKTLSGFRLQTSDIAGTVTDTSGTIDIEIFDDEAAEVALTTFGDVINYSGASAWVRTDSSGNIQNSLNIASCTRVSTGNYDYVFQTPMPNADYSVVATTNASSAFENPLISNQTATGFQVQLRWIDGGNVQKFGNAGHSVQVFATNALPPKGTTGTDAWASVQADGTVDASFNCTIVKPAGSGGYDVTFNTPMPTANYAVTMAPLGTQTIVRYQNRTANGFYVTCRDVTTSGTAKDSGFSFSVNATNCQLPNTVTQEQIESAINNPGASAWCYTSSAGEIQNNLNIASVTKVDTGKYDYVFTTPMPSADYAVTGSVSQSSGTNSGIISFGDVTATGFRVTTKDSSNSNANRSHSLVVHATNALPPTGGTGADAWVNCTSDATITSSFNVASVTNSATGVYDVVFTTPMPDAGYATLATLTSTARTARVVSKTTTGCAVQVLRTTDQSAADSGFSLVIHATNATLPDSFTEEEIQSVVDLAQSGATNPGLSAWGNVEQNGSLLSGLNVASVTRTSNGNYTIAFSTPMPSANYSAVASASIAECKVTNLTANSFEVTTSGSSGTQGNADFQFQVAATNNVPLKGGTGADAWGVVGGSNPATPVLTASFNVASVTRTEKGRFEVLFTTAMPTSSYSVQATINSDTSGVIRVDDQSTTGFAVYIQGNASDSLTDRSFTFTVFATNATLPATLTQDMLVMKAGDTMTGALEVPGITNTGQLRQDGTMQFLAAGVTDIIGLIDGTAAQDGGYILGGTNTSRPGGFTCQSSNPDPSASNVYLSKRTATPYPSSFIVFNRDATVAGGIVSDSFNTVAYNTTSDYRLKENVVSLTGAANRVQQLKPCNYNFIGDPDLRLTEGFLAHELQEVCPTAVTREKDEVDSEGKPLYQGVDLGKIVPLLTAALQEALTRIEALEAQINS